MSDATDAVAQAKALNKRLAATHLVRKQDLEAEIEKLRGSQDPDAEAKIGLLTTDLQVATQNYNDAMAELVNLDKLAGKARSADARVIAASVLSPDPLIRSAEQVALDNVRDRATSMDAMDRLNQELGEDMGQRTPAPPKPIAKPTREEADAAARSEFEALRAKRQSPAGPVTKSLGPSEKSETPTADAEPESTPAPSGPPKRTL